MGPWNDYGVFPVRDGDIGETRRRIELEPIPGEEPLAEPSPEIAPTAEPEPVPA